MGAYQYFGEATRLKAEKLYREMMATNNSANLQHTWYKFLQFLEDDMRALARAPERLHTTDEIMRGTGE